MTTEEDEFLDSIPGNVEKEVKAKGMRWKDSNLNTFIKEVAWWLNSKEDPEDDNDIVNTAMGHHGPHPLRGYHTEKAEECGWLSS